MAPGSVLNTQDTTVEQTKFSVFMGVETINRIKLVESRAFSMATSSKEEKQSREGESEELGWKQLQI